MGRYRLASHNTTTTMKPFVALSALLAAASCQVAYPYSGYPYAAAAYAPYNAGRQFHAQDEFGNLNYGYTNINSVKQEVGNAYGGVSGGYSYVDANGQLQRVEYIADGLGFRVADSRLPVAPVYDGVAPTFSPEPLVAPTFNPEPLVAPVFDGVAPEPVQDTPEVVEARAAHLAAVEAAKSGERRRREAEPAILASGSRVLTAPTPFIHNAPAFAAYSPYTLGAYGAYGYYGYPGYAGLF